MISETLCWDDRASHRTPSTYSRRWLTFSWWTQSSARCSHQEPSTRPPSCPALIGWRMKVRFLSGGLLSYQLEPTQMSQPSFFCTFPFWAPHLPLRLSFSHLASPWSSLLLRTRWGSSPFQCLSNSPLYPVRCWPWIWITNDTTTGFPLSGSQNRRRSLWALCSDTRPLQSHRDLCAWLPTTAWPPCSGVGRPLMAVSLFSLDSVSSPPLGILWSPACRFRSGSHILEAIEVSG